MPKKDPVAFWFPFYVADYMGDTLHLTTEQHGAYLLLLLAAWRTDNRLPNCDEQLQQITKLNPQQWKKSGPILRNFFHITDEFWIHDRVREELAIAKVRMEKRSKAAKAANEKRWSDYRERGPNA